MAPSKLLLPVLPLTESHLPQAQQLSTAAGWPYRLSDWQFAHSLGQGYALEDDGKLVGTAMLWPYGDDFCSMGMIIMAGEYQGFGLGSRLVDTLLESAGSRSAFLNATDAAINLYSRRGFVVNGLLHQHQGKPIIKEDDLCKKGNVVQASIDDLPMMKTLDHIALGMPRTDLIDSLSERGQLFVIRDNSDITGYVICREFGHGYVIGPVIAQTVEDARCLIDAALVKVANQFVRIDVLSDSGLSPWLDRRGLQCVGNATPMYKGQRPYQSRGTHLFALCSQSLG
jgi:GNAT superfamily N-acetyltransferase